MSDAVKNYLIRGAGGASECLAIPSPGKPAASTLSPAALLLMWAHTVPPQKDGSTTEQRVQEIGALGGPARDRIQEARGKHDPPRIMSRPLLIRVSRSIVREGPSRGSKK